MTMEWGHDLKVVVFNKSVPRSQYNSKELYR